MMSVIRHLPVNRQWMFGGQQESAQKPGDGTNTVMGVEQSEHERRDAGNDLD